MPYTIRGPSALQAINKRDDNKTALSVSSSSPLPLITYNKRTNNMIKESPLQFLLTLKLLHKTTCSLSMLKQ